MPIFGEGIVMIKKILLIVIIFFTFSACAAKTAQTAESTRIISKTIEITKIIPQTVVVTQISEGTKIVPQTVVVTQIVTETTNPEKTLALKSTTITPSNPAELSIVQFLTYLDKQQYQEAYQLFGANFKDTQSYEKWVKLQNGIDHVKILELKTYNEFAKEQGLSLVEDGESLKSFYVVISVIGKDTSMKEQKNSLFIKVALESGFWKILPPSTSPFSS